MEGAWLTTVHPRRNRRHHGRWRPTHPLPQTLALYESRRPRPQSRKTPSSFWALFVWIFFPAAIVFVRSREKREKGKSRAVSWAAEGPSGMDTARGERAPSWPGAARSAPARCYARPPATQAPQAPHSTPAAELRPQLPPSASSGIHSKNTHTPLGSMPRLRSHGEDERESNEEEG